MKRISIFLTGAILALVMVSCGEGGSPFGKKSAVVSPVSEKINGPLGDYFSVENSDYKVIDGKVRIGIKRIQDGFPAPWKKGIPLGYSEGCYEPSFTAEFLDESGNVVYKSTTDIVSQKDELQFLAANKVGESSSVTFRIDGSKSAKVRIGSLFNVHGTQLPSSVSNIELDNNNLENDSLEAPHEVIEQVVEDIIEKEKGIIEQEQEEDEEEEEEEVTVKSGKNWDKILDQLEQYVDSYVRLLKKASSGDMSAMAEYAEMLEKAQALSEELDQAQDEMTPAQLKRYAKITQKLTDAALDLYR